MKVKMLGKTDLYLTKLLKMVKEEGVLIETMPKGTSFLFDTRKQYKRCLGCIPVSNIFGNITNVYIVYEDFDDSIKYYDYPQFSNREIKDMRKLWERNKDLAR